MNTATKNRYQNMRAALREQDVYLQAQKVPKDGAGAVKARRGYDLEVEPDTQGKTMYSPKSFWHALPLALFTPFALIVVFLANVYYYECKDVAWSEKSIWGRRGDDGFFLGMVSITSLTVPIPCVVDALQGVDTWVVVALIVAFIVLQVVATFVLWCKVITPLVRI